MKFKITVIGLLTTILTVCLFTSYTLIQKASQQIEFQKLQAEIELKTFETENSARIWLETEHDTIERSIYYELNDKYNELCREN